MTGTSGYKGQLSADQRSNDDELDAAEFCKLLLSRSHLLRIDEPGARMRILFDPASGKTYRIDGSKLDRYVESHMFATAG